MKVKTSKNNRKGFTLMELLAVIVILAVLILVAMPAVTSLMTRSRKSALRTEALSFAKDGVQVAYSSLMLSGVSTTIASGATTKENVVYKIKDGEFLCMTVGSLISKGYIEKTNTAGYAGHVSLFVDNNGKSKMYIHLFNGTYYIVADYEALAKNADVDTAVVTAKPSNYVAGCPTDVTASMTGAAAYVK